MELKDFVFLGNNQQETYLCQLLTKPVEQRNYKDSVLIMWYFKNYLNTFPTRKEADEMSLETYLSIKNKKPEQNDI